MDLPLTLALLSMIVDPIHLSCIFFTLSQPYHSIEPSLHPYTFNYELRIYGISELYIVLVNYVYTVIIIM